jgi:hypothetical protein
MAPAENRSVISAIVLTAVFLIFSLFFILSKSNNLSAEIQALQSGEYLLEEHYGALLEPSLPAGMRIGAGLAYLALEGLVHGLAVFVVNDPSSAPFYPGKGWGQGAHFTAGYLQTVIVPIISSVIWKLLALSIIPILALTLYNRTETRALFTAIVLISLVGWPDILLNGYFALMKIGSDWPISHYLFTERVNPYDIGAIFFLNLLVYYLVVVKTIKWWHVALFAFFAQITFEFLGFIVGVSLFLWTFLEKRRAGGKAWGLALTRLSVAGVVSVMVFVGLVFLVHEIHPHVFEQYRSTIFTQGAEEEISKLEDFWNFADQIFIAALFMTVFIFPILIGFGFGAFAGVFVPNRDMAVADRGLRACIVVLCAFALALIIGLPVTGYASELGRQALSGVTVTFTSAALASERLMQRLRNV